MTRGRLLFVFLLLAGCGDGLARNVLCAYCDADSQCGGNPCFGDASGGRFCGRPCDDGCPTGFSCLALLGTSSPSAVLTCFPDNESCADTPVPGQNGLSTDLLFTPHQDGGVGHNVGGVPVGGPVGATGGTVDRLLFGVTGDTRPPDCASSYGASLQQVINGIYSGMQQKGVQFVVDQGDHMFNCGYGQPAFGGAAVQMQSYLAAANLLGGKTVFMTMGNHECTNEASQLCSATGSMGTNPNYTAFMQAMAPISALPYYRFDVTTNAGLAVFLVVADDVWDSAEESWLTAQLDDADARARYTFVSKHHPKNNSDHPEFQTIYNLITSHKYTLFFTGHSHLYKREFGDPRTMVIGCGGAPLAGGSFNGYGVVEQGLDGYIIVNVYDVATGNVMDSFNVPPQ